MLDKATREIVAIRYAALMQLCEDRRTELEPMGDYYRFSDEVFYGTEPIEGCDDWLIISDFPVELSRHTRMKCITKVVMDRLFVVPPSGGSSYHIRARPHLQDPERTGHLVRGAGVCTTFALAAIARVPPKRTNFRLKAGLRTRLRTTWVEFLTLAAKPTA